MNIPARPEFLCPSFSCPVCHQNQAVEKVETKRDYGRGESYMFAKCSGCGLVFDPEFETPALDYAEKEYIDIRRYVESDAGILFFAYLLTLLSACLRAEIRSRFSLLEIGCGPGLLLDMARFLGAKAVGIEPCAEYVRWGRETLGLNIQEGYFDQETELPGEFDVIVCTEVLEHVPNPSGFLQAIAKRLKGDGVFVLTTPNVQSGELAQRSDKSTLLVPGIHILLYNETALRVALSRAGFQSLAIVTAEGPYGTERLIALASKERGAGLRARLDPVYVPWSNQSRGAVQLAIDYLSHLKARTASHKCPIWEGATARLVECLNIAGELHRGAVVADELDVVLEERGVGQEKIEGQLSRPVASGEEADLFHAEGIPWYLAAFSAAKGFCFVGSGRYSEAARAFALAGRVYEIVEAGPVALETSYRLRSLECWYQQGYSLLLAGEQNQALEVFDRLLPRRGSLAAETLGDLLFNRGIALLQLGLSDEAREMFEEILSNQSSFSADLCAQAETHKRMSIGYGTSAAKASKFEPPQHRPHLGPDPGLEELRQRLRKLKGLL